ncbi:MAG: tyrosine-type recombinase/integrase [Spirochaetes bacterium]|nr:tyrosine-type recombinase/integrase [Spirochaetota bacterium]
MKQINDFLKYLSNQNYSNKTIKDYKYILSCFEKFLNEKQIYNEKNVSETDFKEYIAKYKECNCHSFYYKSVTIIKKYFRFLNKFNYILISPIEKYKNPKQVVKHHPVIDKNDLSNFLNNLDENNPFEVRTRAMIELLYSSALRPSECLNLNISDIDYYNKVILIRKTKTKTDRIVPVTNEALLWINKYINKIRSKNILPKSENKIFISFHSNNPVTVKGIRNSLKYFSIKKNIKRFSMYSIRASSATHLFENGMSINYLQLLLGHKDLRATIIYVRVSFLRLKELLEKYHPRNKLEDKRNFINEVSEIN